MGTTPPPDKSSWDETAKPWCVANFEQRHALLKPILEAYLAARPKGPSSLGSFLHAFYMKEGQRPHKAVGAAAEFLLMEHWREGWRLSEVPGMLPEERRAARALMDPILQAASAAATKESADCGKRWHRESVEFAKAVVRHAIAINKRQHLTGANSDTG